MEEQPSSQSSSIKFHDEKFVESPPAKKQKVEVRPKSTEKLEERLNHILKCSVCLDLPSSACMQCCHGHLMCIGCYHHLLADARLKDEQATCPSCRVDISRGSCIRNLAVEKAISELPVECSFCFGMFPRSSLVSHEKDLCQERLVNCRFKQLGCGWSGPAHELSNHCQECSHPSKPHDELVKCLEVINHRHGEQTTTLRSIIDLLSCEQISYNEVQLRPYRTDDFVTKLFYESNRFHMLGQMWALKAFVSAVERHPSNPTLTTDRKLSFQLLLKSKIGEPLELDILLLRAPFDEVKIAPKLFHARFTPDKSDTELQPIESENVNRMLGSKFINVRLFMFQPH